MTLDEAYSEAVCGSHMTAAHMQPGVCLTYDFKGFRRTWPNGDGCDFIAREDDQAADWYEYVPPQAKPKDAWGRPNDAAYVEAVDKLIGVKTVKAAGVVSFEQAQRIGAAMNKPQLTEPSKWGKPVAKDKWGKPT